MEAFVPVGGVGRVGRRLFVAVEVIGLLGALVYLFHAGSDGPQLALIPTLIAVTAKKFFGKTKGDPEDALGDHPVVAFIFNALTTGDVDEAEDIVAANLGAYANGYIVVDPDEEDGAQLFKDNIEYWRATVPDLAIDLYDEVSQKDPDKTDSIAVRYVISGTLEASGGTESFEAEVAAFVKVVDHKLTEWRVVVDETVFERLRAAMGLPPPGDPVATG